MPHDAILRATQQAEAFRLSVKGSRGSSSGPVRMLTAGPSSIPYSRPTFADAIEQLAHYKGHVWTCVSAIASKVAEQSVMVANAKLSQKDFQKAYLVSKSGKTSFQKAYLDSLVPIQSHPLLDAIDTPNDLMTRWSLMFTTASCIKLTGKAFWWLARRDDGGREIWPLPPSWVQPTDSAHSGWLVTPLGVGIEPFPVQAKNMAYFAMHDPANPFMAISPLQTQAAAVDTDERLELARANAFRNGIFPAMAVIAGDATASTGEEGQPFLYDHQRAQIETTMNKLHRGVHNYGSYVILDALIKDIKPISNKPSEMGFIESGPMLRDRIFQAFYVNPIIVGQTEGANRAQAVMGIQTFFDYAVNPLLMLMGEVMNRWVGPRFGSNLKVWIEPCRPNDHEISQLEWSDALKWGQVTRNEYRTRVLRLPPTPGADVYILPANVDAVPVNADLTELDDEYDDEGRDEPVGEGESGAEESSE